MKEINRYGLLSSLINTLNTFDEDNSKVVISKYLLQNFKQIDELNIYETADECFVTRASIRRFSEYIGFENFRGLKSDYVYYSYYQKKPSADEYHEFLSDKMLKSMIKRKQYIKKELDSIMKYINNCNQIILLTSDIYSSRCVEFQKSMILAGKMVRIVSYNFTGNKLLKSLDGNDLLITISVTGLFATSVNKFMSEFVCKKALLTEKYDEPLHLKYDFTLHFGNKTLPPMKSLYHVFAVECYLDVIRNIYCNDIV